MHRRHFLRSLSFAAAALTGIGGAGTAFAQQPMRPGPPGDRDYRHNDRPPMRPMPGRPPYAGPHRPPPPPRRERRPAPPRRHGFAWTDGYWAWRGGHYVWVPGRWVAARPGRRWIAPHWQQRGQVWIFIDGRWN